MSHASVFYHPTPLGSGSMNIFISQKVNDTSVAQILGREIALDVALLTFETARIVCRLFRWMSHLAKFLDSNIFARRSLSCDDPCGHAHAATRHRELVVNKALELGDNHVVIIFLEVYGIKSASLDEKSQVGVQPSLIGGTT